MLNPVQVLIGQSELYLGFLGGKFTVQMKSPELYAKKYPELFAKNEEFCFELVDGYIIGKIWTKNGSLESMVQHFQDLVGIALQIYQRDSQEYVFNVNRVT